MSISSRAVWRPTAIVFDLDGLLVDSEPIFRESATRLLRARGQDARHDVFDRMMGTPAREALALLREVHELPEAVEELMLESARLFYDVLGERTIPLLPGARQLLTRLRDANRPYALATSSSLRYARRVLEPHGLLGGFQFLLTAEDVRLGKPAPEIYEKAAARFGCPASGMLVLEDSPAGLTAAKAAGARCVVVPHDLVPRRQIEAADWIVPSLEARELLEVLDLI